MPDKRNSARSELIDLCQVWIQSVADLRDYAHYTGHVVLNGTGFLVTQPSATYLLREEVEKVHSKEKHRCDRTEDVHTIWANKLKQDGGARLKTFVLLKFPRGITVTSDMDKNSVIDGPVKLTARPVEANETVMGQETTRTTYLGFWNIRIVREHSILKVVEEDTGLDDAFAGMAVS